MDAAIDEGLDVVLRPARSTDTERWLETLLDPYYRQFGAPDFIPVPDRDAMLAKVTSSVENWAERRPGALAVAAAHDPDHFLGDISWRWTASERLRIAELGYVLHPDSRGRGVGRLAIALLARWLLHPEGRGLARVQLDHSVENHASCRVALAAGFEREGLRRGFLPLRGADGQVRRHDVCLHGVIAAPPLPG